MEQVSRPSETSELEALEAAATEQSNFFWNVKPSEILNWGKAHKPELALVAGMGAVTMAISGAALSVLFSPHLGRAITYKPLIDEATLAASRRLSLGDQLLGQVARVLEIEIIETQGPDVGHRHRAVPAMTIVAQADQAAPMPQADLAVGLKTMLIAAGVGLGVTGLMRLLPLLPPFPALGKQRRQPLSQRLTASVGEVHPLAPGDASRRPSRSSQTLMPGALTSLAISVQDSNLSQSRPSQNVHAGPARTAHPNPKNLLGGGRRDRRDRRGKASGAQTKPSNQPLHPMQTDAEAGSEEMLRSNRSNVNHHPPVMGGDGQPQASPSQSRHRPFHRSSSGPTSFVTFTALSVASDAQRSNTETSRPVLLPQCHGPFAS